jgi:hypothetical protein
MSAKKITVSPFCLPIQLVRRGILNLPHSASPKPFIARKRAPLLNRLPKNQKFVVSNDRIVTGGETKLAVGRKFKKIKKMGFIY